MAQTLEQLKAANAAEEVAQVQTTEETPKVEPKAEPEVDEPENSFDEEITGDEPWLQTDEQTSDGDDDGGTAAKFTDSDVANVRRKLKGKLREEQEKSKSLEEEVAELKALIAAGKTSPVQRQQRPGVPNKPPKVPKLSDFGYDEERYNVALANWVQQQNAASSQQQAQKAQEQEQIRETQRKLNEAVDNHYTRANDLVRKANIDPEVYRKADSEVRKAVDSVIPNGGDSITDGLIQRLGDGSEKVLYYLGRNKSKLDLFVNKLREDPSGVSASIMLGQLQSEVIGSTNRGSNAPSPSRQLSGDGGSKESASALKRKYQRAGDDIQKRIDIKREAKRNGIDVSGW